MPDRLSELARQRALVSEHLAWLEREIADETAKREASSTALPTTPLSSASAPAARPASPAAPIATPAPAVVSATTTESDDILAQFRVEPSTMKQDVRKGCLLYFIAAFVLLGLVVAVLYFSIGTQH